MLKLENVTKSYRTGDFIQHALKGVSLEFRENEFVSILGPSGSGKTTLLNIIGGLDRYDTGDLIINGKSTKRFNDRDWDAYRNNCIGFIFQSYNLIGHISVLANVEMCMTLSGVSSKEKKKRAIEVLEKVGLKDHIHKKPNQLSGGQMQRVAIARALVNNPDVILADEPTGALDSETSVQIMELIKEIAKDKLVIMVTHNPELAKTYSTRIVEFKDGQLVNDSNPISNTEKDGSNFKIKKTSMGFFAALHLSLSNIITKKGRTLITAFASSIGIIGIALILSLSNGFNIQIDKFERDTLSQMPIVISEQAMNLSQEDMASLMGTGNDDLEEYPSDNIIRPLETIMDKMHTNDITKEYKEYIDSINPDLIGGVSYMRATSLNILTKTNDNKIKILNNANMFFPLPQQIDPNRTDTIIEDNFELIYGQMPKNKEDLLLLIDTKNRIDSTMFEALGYTKDDTITFEELLGKEFKVVLNDDLFTNMGNFFIMNTNFENLYNSENTITLKVTGIIRGKEGNKFAEYSGNGFTYKEELMTYLIEKNSNSAVVKAQRDSEFNVLTGEQFDLTTEDGRKTKDTILAYLGDDMSPIVIQIYPKSFDTKKEVLNYLDKYNEGKSEDDKILYTDYADAITSLSENIMNAITIVLVAFSAISLVVSSIMIAIITYISVLERTKEIGILRAIGARKKDITRVFNAETFIIGICSGLIGIGIARLLLIPVNIVLKNLTELENVAQMNPVHAIILIVISIVLILIGGFIPAKMASKRDPVEALRTE